MLIVVMLVSVICFLGGCAATSPPVTPTFSPPAETITPTPASCLEDGAIHHQEITYAAGELPIYLNYYLPPCYEQQVNSRYPVVYFLHGAGGDEHTWNPSNRLAQTLNSLIRSGRIPPLKTCGYLKSFLTSFFEVWYKVGCCFQSSTSSL